MMKKVKSEKDISKLCSLIHSSFHVFFSYSGDSWSRHLYHGLERTLIKTHLPRIFRPLDMINVHPNTHIQQRLSQELRVGFLEVVL